MSDETQSNLRAAALHFHEHPRPGKVELTPTKPLANSRDLALAYSPGVAAPCEEIATDPQAAYRYTAKGNLVAVISNGTAVLGLGNIGALASKPVMEGKAVLFKKFAGIDGIDVEVAETDPKKFIEIVAPLEPSFGGINLEDIKAPDCFEIEETLRERMAIPVFHDDQHGTAIIVAAATLNAMRLVGKELSEAKICTSGAGAAALACMNMLIAVGAKRENIWIADSKGIVTKRRANSVDRWRAAFAQDTDKTDLAEVMPGADIYVGLSQAGALKPEMIREMARDPLILALSNPVPEIMPEVAIAERPDALICTGRSDYPNQVNNVLCFPFIFRGALDCGATTINEDMKRAAAYAIAELAHEPGLEATASGEPATFNRGYLIPSPFDQRLILRISPAVARAAAESGVARRPIADMDAYEKTLRRFVFRSGLAMGPIIERVQGKGTRIALANGEDERVLRAAQVIADEKLGKPILIGRPAVIEQRLQRFGLTLKLGQQAEVINQDDDPRYRHYVSVYHQLVDRKGVNLDRARTVVRTNTGVIAAVMVHQGEADAALVGLEGTFTKHISEVQSVLGPDQVGALSTLSMLITSRGPLFLADTLVNPDPSAEDLVRITLQARDHMKRFSVDARVALLSYSNFGSREGTSVTKMREVRRRLKEVAPDLPVEGEMQGDVALNGALRSRYLARSHFQDEANLLIFPNLDAASIATSLLTEVNNALVVGPILMGVTKPVHILVPSVTSRGIVNMAAIAAAEVLGA